MAIREYAFDNGFGTSQIPTGGTPTGDLDLINKEYADETYAFKSSWGDKVATINDLKAVSSAIRIDTQLVQVTDVGTGGTLYQFDAASALTGDDDLVVEPNSGTGRWIKFQPTGSGGGGGSASGKESLMQKLEAEKFGIVTESLDDSVGISGRFIKQQTYTYANFQETVLTSATVVNLIWNGLSFDAGSANYDSTTNWAVTSAGASLTLTTTAGQFKVGTGALKFDKNNTATTAAIRHTRAAQDLILASNTRHWVDVFLPSTTDLTDVYIVVYADSTSNGHKYTVTTQYDGSGFSNNAWNTLMFDLSTGGTVIGTDWTPTTKAAKIGDWGVTTGSAATTYTGIIFDAMFYSLNSPEKLGVIGSEYTLYDSSGQQNIVVASSNTRSDGPVTLAAALSAGYAGGVTGSARAVVKRSTTSNVGDGFINMDRDSNLSGTVTTTQYLREGAILRESVSTDYEVFADMLPVQMYVVNTVGGSTIGVDDPTDQHLNLLNGDTMEIFRPYYYEGKVYYTLLASRALTANSSASGGTTTLTLTTTSIAVGDIVCKRHLTEMALSSVSTPTTNDSFSALTLDADPNGIILREQGFDYPNRQYVYAHYLVGAFNDTYALKNQLGLAADMTKTGSPNLQLAGPPHRLYSGGSYTGSNYTSATAASTQPLSGDVNTDLTSILQISCWLYFDAIDAANARTFISRSNAAGSTGWYLGVNNNENKVSWTFDTAGVITSANNTNALVAGAWNHLVMVYKDGTGRNHIWTNGVDSTGSSGNNAVAAVQPLVFGNIGGNNVQPATNLKLSDVIFWVNGPELTSAQIQQLYNAGRGLATGISPELSYRATSNGQSGQKIAIRNKLQTSTTAITAKMIKAGMIPG